MRKVAKSCKKLQKNFYCEVCDYSCSNKYNFNKHKMTAKHKNANYANLNANYHANKKLQENICKNCSKVFTHKSSLSRHLKSCKKRPQSVIQKLSKSYPSYPKIIHSKFACECGKSYKYASGLSKHRKTCIFLENVVEEIADCTDIVPTNNVEKLLKNIMLDNKAILEENKVLREKISTLELGNTYNTNNTQNNQFNINMFLNEKCKNAMNLEDFVEKIKLSLDDLQYTNKNGYTDGITNIFIKNLSDMDVTERPIHCSDQKRLQFYVKNADEWSKDKNNEKLDNSIEQVSQKQLKSVNEWTKANPDFMENDKKREEYMDLVNKAIQPNNKKNLRSIKRKIGENVKLEKTNE